MKIYAFIYQESDLLGPLHSPRKKSKAEFCFEVKCFYSLLGNFSVLFSLSTFAFLACYYFRGGSRDFGKEGGRAKKAEITLGTIDFWQNISISIFKFSSFSSIKSYHFFKIY